MRMMLRVSLPVEASNKAIKDGSLPRTIEGMIAQTKPEAAYFYPDNGKRTALFVFDMKDPSQIPQIAEPFFMNLSADVHFTPVMNGDDLKAGLGEVMKRLG